MGALHPGHLSLVAESTKENSVTVVSIFVNPTQFNSSTDFSRYPITTEQDIRLLEETTSVLFLPSVAEIYPNGTTNLKRFDLGGLETSLEGSYRPGHFQGVCNVVERLLDIINPHRLYMGQKDFQQCAVITRLLQLTGREHTSLIISPTIRETSGLAMSSRNMRLNEKQKKHATVIYKTLMKMKSQLGQIKIPQIVREAEKSLTEAGLNFDYITIVDRTTLQPEIEWDGKKKLVALAAVYEGEVRLIDNISLN
jgi:pantoate--beta-alanine ligase